MEATNVVLITNVGQGYGRAIALAFGRAHHDVMCADRDVELATKTAAEIEEQGGQAIPIQADMSTQIDVRNAFGKVREIFGSPTGVVHVASYESHTPFFSLTEPEHAELLNENLRSSLLSLKVASQQLTSPWFVLVGPPTSADEPQMVSLRGALQGLAGSLQERTEKLRVNLIFPSRAASDPAHDARVSETVLFLGSDRATGIAGQTFHIVLPPPPKIIEDLLPEVRAALDENMQQADLEASLFIDDAGAGGEVYSRETPDSLDDREGDLGRDLNERKQALNPSLDLDNRGTPSR